jgi:hypothetical protein
MIHEDGSASGLLELHGAPDVVDVAVSDEDLRELQVVTLESVEDAVDVGAGIDNDGFVGEFVSDDGAVALKRADGKDFVDHKATVTNERFAANGQKSKEPSRITKALLNQTKPRIPGAILRYR